MKDPLFADIELEESLAQKIDRLCDDLCTELHRLAFQPICNASYAYLLESYRYDIQSTVKRVLSIYEGLSED